MVHLLLLLGAPRSQLSKSERLHTGMQCGVTVREALFGNIPWVGASRVPPGLIPVTDDGRFVLGTSVMS